MTTEVLAFALSAFVLIIAYSCYRSLQRIKKSAGNKAPQKININQFSRSAIELYADPSDRTITCRQLGEEIHMDYTTIPVFVLYLNELWRRRPPKYTHVPSPDCDGHAYPEIQ